MTVTRDLLRNYTKLWWHRCLPVEAMRSIAFRNRDHFFVTSVRLGGSDRADPEATTCIFDKMLQDQGKEQTEEERWVLGWASRASWEVYMCLLYALVEQYKRIRRDHPSVAYPPLDNYLQSHEALVDRLRAVRDKLLHPLNEADYSDSLSSLSLAAQHDAHDLYLALEQLQNQLDDFLERLREVLHESLEDEVVDLPADEMAVYFHRFKEQTRSRAERAGNADVLADMDRRSGELEAHEQVIRSQLSADFALDAVGLGRVERLEKTRNVLLWPLPKRPYQKRTDSVQTPVDPNLAARVWLAIVGGQVALLEQRLPGIVMQHRSGILELLVRSITIFNETFAALLSRVRSAYPEVPVEALASDEELWMETLRRSTPTDTSEDLHRAMLEVTPYRTALALLAEPLRIYQESIKGKPELNRDEIDNSTLAETVRVFGELRNTIFHVPRGQADLFEADTQLALAPISHGQYLDVVAGLTHFLQGTDPATV